MKNKYNYTFKKKPFAAQTEGLKCVFSLPHLVSMNDVIITHIHEDLHVEIGRATNFRTTEKEEHWAIQRMECDWF